MHTYIHVYTHIHTYAYIIIQYTHRYSIIYTELHQVNTDISFAPLVALGRYHSKTRNQNCSNVTLTSIGYPVGCVKCKGKMA